MSEESVFGTDHELALDILREIENNTNRTKTSIAMNFANKTTYIDSELKNTSALRDNISTHLVAAFWSYEEIVNDRDKEDARSKAIVSARHMYNTSRSSLEIESARNLKPVKKQDGAEDQFEESDDFQSKRARSRSSNQPDVKPDRYYRDITRDDIKNSLEDIMRNSLNNRKDNLSSLAADLHLQEMKISETSSVNNREELEKRYKSLYSEMLQNGVYKSLAEDTSQNKDLFPQSTIKEWNEEEGYFDLEEKIVQRIKQLGESAYEILEVSGDTLNSAYRSKFGVGFRTTLGGIFATAIVIYLVYLHTGVAPPMLT